MPGREQLKTLESTQNLQEILSRLAHLRDGQPPLWGRLHAPAMLRHLHEAFELALRERPVKPHRYFLRGPQVRWMVLYSGVPWIRNFKTVPEVDVLLKQEIVGNLETERQRLVCIMDRFSGCSERDLLAQHPLFGPFAYRDWMRWGYLHTDHHLRQFGC